jgi:hypothetical protein
MALERQTKPYMATGQHKSTHIADNTVSPVVLTTGVAGRGGIGPGVGVGGTGMTGAGSYLVPQRLQNSMPSSMVFLQFWHTLASTFLFTGLPHFPQNENPSGTSLPQLVQ